MREDDGFCFYLLPKDMVIASLSPSLSFSTWRSTCLSQYGPTACPSLPPLNLSLPPVSHYVPTACLSPSGSATCFSLSGPTAYHLPPVSHYLGLLSVSHYLGLPSVSHYLGLPPTTCPCVQFFCKKVTDTTNSNCFAKKALRTDWPNNVWLGLSRVPLST